MRRTKTQQIRAVTELIRKNPKITVSDLKEKTGVNITRVLGGVRKAYETSGIPYSKKLREVKLREIISYIKENNLATTNEINSALNCSFFKYFKSLKDAYRTAGIRYIGKHSKHSERKRSEIINYIKTHPEATQRDINLNCKTKVQEIFNDGVRGAFKIADVRYDIHRRNIHGAVLKTVRTSARNLEKDLANILRERFGEFGKIFEQVRSAAGIIDILLEFGNQKIVIEVKDYKIKPISLSDVRKVKNYSHSVNAATGIIITKKRLNKSDELAGIKIFELAELDKVFAFLEEPNNIYSDNLKHNDGKR